MFSNDKKLQNVADIVSKIMNEKLHPNQQKLDVHEPEKDKLTADDFKKLRAGKKVQEATAKPDFLDLDKDGNKKEPMKKASSSMKKEDADPCWKGYKMVGMKDKNGRKVPNCVPGEGVPAMKKEEAEQLKEYQSKGGVYKHKGTYGTEKSVEAGYTDYDKENEMAKKLSKPAKKKYGARQNFVRSTRVNESFSALLGVYKESGLKGLEEALVKEEPTNDQYNAELDDAKAKAEGKKKQPDLTKGYIQAVKNEEIEVLDADKINGVQIDTIEEREMTEPEMKKREEIVKSMKKGMTGFKERYGERAKNVMYATATKQAMKD